MDVIEGSAIFVSDEGVEIRRIAVISEMTGDAASRMVDAVADPRLPEIGSTHPAYGTATLREKSGRPLSHTAVEVTMLYRQENEEQSYDPYQSTIEVGTALSQESSTDDYQGNLVTVIYNGKETPATFSKLIPQTTVVARRQETMSPLFKSREYVGKVNSGGWTCVANTSARSWMCTRITGNSNDGGETFEVTYEFAYRPPTPEGDPGWDKTVYYIDPTTGGMPEDAVPGVGVKTVQIYEAIDFNGLGL